MMNSPNIAWEFECVQFPSGIPVTGSFHCVRAVEFHLHTSFEILLVLSGRIALYTEGREEFLDVGDLALLHSGQPHATHDLGTDNVVLALQIDPAVSRHDTLFLRRRFDLAELLALPEGKRRYHQLRALVAQTARELRMKRLAWEMEVEALVLRLLAHLVRHIPNKLLAATDTALLPDESQTLGAHLQRVAEYVRAHAGEALSIGEVAQEMSLSTSYLARLFRAETGKTFGAFLTKVRLRRSLDLLAAPQKPTVVDVALGSGFPNVKAYHQAFRAVFNCTPMQWRNARIATPGGPRTHYGSIDESLSMKQLSAFVNET